jgi:outer membrane immunogenic protein
MRYTVHAAAAFVVLASMAPAGAQAPPPPGTVNWAGPYVGLNLGGDWGQLPGSVSVPATPAGAVPGSPAVAGRTAHLSGGTNAAITGGGQAGYNWQFNQNWVFGVEADIQGTGQNGTATLPSVVFTPPPGATVLPSTTTTASLQSKLPWFGTARLRLGVLPSDQVLLYVTGGLAFGEVQSNASFATAVAFPGGPVIASAASASSANSTRAGWTIGGGAEWVISGPWTAKLEYLYVDLGSVANTFTGIGSYPTLGTSSHITDSILRVGVNYRFGGPVVARY